MNGIFNYESLFHFIHFIYESLKSMLFSAMLFSTFYVFFYIISSFCLVKSEDFRFFIYHNITTFLVPSSFRMFVSYTYIILSTINFSLYCLKHLKDDVFILCVSYFFYYLFLFILFCIFSFSVYSALTYIHHYYST